MNKNNIPGPKGHWLTGNMKALSSAPLDFINEQYQTWNDISQFRAGPVRIYCVGNPAYIQQAMNDEGISKAKLNQKLLQPVMGNGLFVSEGDYWKQQRKTLTPVFKPKRIGDYQKLMLRPAQKFIDSLKNKTEIKLMPEVTAVTVDTLISTIFGLNDSLNIEKLDKHLEILAAHFIEHLSHPIRAPRWVPTKSNRDLNENVKAVLDIVKELMKKHDVAVTAAADDTLINALRHAESDDGNIMNQQQLLDEVSTFFLAGHETTATSLLWAIYNLSKQPELQKKLRTELEEQLNGKPISKEDFGKLPYLKAVIDETLRLYPSGYVLGREVKTNNYYLGDLHLKKGAWLLVPVFSIHRNPKWYANPETFFPDRWLGDLKKELPKNGFMPFGAGKRLCIGEHFARNELMTLLATIYQNYETYTLPGKPEPQIFAAVTLRPDRDVFVGLRALNPRI